ncbi:MAG: NUDIX domain-containing protein [Candidatus Uhrbacteria bacterium]
MKQPTEQDIKVATDAVIFTVRHGELMALLIQMKKAPYTDKWAVPGGIIGQAETTEQAARRILITQTGVTQAHLEQLATFDDPKRDKIGRVISVAYVALVASEKVVLQTTDRYADVRWWPAGKLPALAYDHKEVVAVAVERLRSKLEYTNVAWSLLPKAFTLSELQETYETILGRALDKRNFRRKVLELRLVEPTGEKSSGGAHRPAEMYAFKRRGMEYIEVL